MGGAGHTQQRSDWPASEWRPGGTRGVAADYWTPLRATPTRLGTLAECLGKRRRGRDAAPRNPVCSARPYWEEARGETDTEAREDKSIISEADRKYLEAASRENPRLRTAARPLSGVSVTRKAAVAVDA